jgi:chromosomal replication initiation ATPase DnaA
MGQSVQEIVQGYSEAKSRLWPSKPTVVKRERYDEILRNLKDRPRKKVGERTEAMQQKAVELQTKNQALIEQARRLQAENEELKEHVSELEVKAEDKVSYMKGEDIIELVAIKHMVSKSAIMGSGRSRYIVRARWEAFVALRDHLGWGLSRIGHFFNKDHTTVLCGWRGYESKMLTDPDFVPIKIEQLRSGQSDEVVENA